MKLNKNMLENVNDIRAVNDMRAVVKTFIERSVE